MLRADLKAAGIPYRDESDRVVDFHSLRHTTGSLLAAAGVNPKVAQTILRHSDINLTMSRYTHVFRGQESEAVGKLPDLGKPSEKAEQARATGTEGENCLAICLANEGENKRTSANVGEQITSDRQETRVAANSPISANKSSYRADGCNTPGRIRTSNLRFRRPMLYPIELRAQIAAASYLAISLSGPIKMTGRGAQRP